MNILKSLRCQRSFEWCQAKQISANINWIFVIKYEPIFVWRKSELLCVRMFVTKSLWLCMKAFATYSEPPQRNKFGSSESFFFRRCRRRRCCCCCCCLFVSLSVFSYKAGVAILDFISIWFRYFQCKQKNGKFEFKKSRKYFSRKFCLNTKREIGFVCFAKLGFLLLVGKFVSPSEMNFFSVIREQQQTNEIHIEFIWWTLIQIRCLVCARSDTKINIKRRQKLCVSAMCGKVWCTCVWSPHRK